MKLLICFCAVVVCALVISAADAAPKSPARQCMGVHLGETNAVAALYNPILWDADVVLLAAENNSYLLPSVVALGQQGELLSGSAAQHRRLDCELKGVPCAAFGMKRFLGRDMKDPVALDAVDKQLFNMTFDSHGNIVVRLSTPEEGVGRELSPEEAIAPILRALAGAAPNLGGAAIDCAVVAVPPHFTDAQRQATKDAGAIAGIDVIRVINEPTAAAIAHQLDKVGEARILVVHMGGRTLEVTALVVDDGFFEVVGFNVSQRGGGGDEVNARIVELVKNRSGHEMVNAASEGARVKHELSVAETAEIALERGARFRLSRKELEESIKDIIDEIRVATSAVIAEANLTADEIDYLVLSGGSTRIPIISQSAAQLFANLKPTQHIEPDQVVARGAAIQAAVLTGVIETRGCVLCSTLPLSIGIGTVGKLSTRLLERNLLYPARVSRNFTTQFANQTSVAIDIYQGERVKIEHLMHIGRLELHGLKPQVTGEAAGNIEVAVEMDEDFVLHVTAIDHASGGLNSTSFPCAEHQLTAETIETLVIDRSSHDLEDLTLGVNAHMAGLHTKLPPAVDLPAKTLAGVHDEL